MVHASRWFCAKIMIGMIQSLDEVSNRQGLHEMWSEASIWECSLNILRVKISFDIIGPKIGDRGQGTGDRGQGTGDRGQGTGDRGQGTGDRGQGTGDRGQGTGDRGQGTGDRGQGTGDRGQGTGK